MIYYKPTQEESTKLKQLFEEWNNSASLAASWKRDAPVIVGFLKSTSLANMDYNDRATAMDNMSAQKPLFDWRSWFSVIPTYQDGYGENISRSAYVLATENFLKNSIDKEADANVAYTAFKAALDLKDLELVKAYAAKDKAVLDLETAETEADAAQSIGGAVKFVAAIIVIYLIIKIFKN